MNVFSSRYRQGGFTLIELMIVVVIIGILAAIAYPSYQNQIRKTKRAEAKGALAELAVRQEKYYAQCSTYSSNVAGPFPTNSSSCGPAAGLGDNVSTATGLYTLDIPVSGTTFTARATANSGTSQVNDTGCTAMTLTNMGVKGPVGSNCW